LTRESQAFFLLNSTHTHRHKKKTETQAPFPLPFLPIGVKRGSGGPGKRRRGQPASPHYHISIALYPPLSLSLSLSLSVYKQRGIWMAVVVVWESALTSAALSHTRTQRSLSFSGLPGCKGVHTPSPPKTASSESLSIT